MTETKIADIIVPEVFNPYFAKATKEKNEFFNSGIVTDMSGTFDLSLGGETINMPFFNDLSGASEVLSESGGLTLNNVGTGKDIAVVLERGKAWGANDLASSHAGADVVGHIAGRVGDYWSRDFNAVLISTLKGAFLPANMSGNRLDVSGVGAGLWTPEAYLDAKQLLGDAKTDLGAIVMHSAVETFLAKLNLIDFIRDSDSGALVRVYLGDRVIIDDNLTATATVYPTYLFGRGSVGFNEDTTIVMSETDRTGLTGVDELITRRRYVMHPMGVAFQSDTVAGASPTNAELELTANWSQVFAEDKQIPIVQFKFKIG